MQSMVKSVALIKYNECSRIKISAVNCVIELAKKDFSFLKKLTIFSKSNLYMHKMYKRYTYVYELLET